MNDGMPWLKHYGDVPANLDYPDYSLYEAIKNTSEKHPDWVAYEFLGRNVDYKSFLKRIDRFALCLYKLGVKKGDSVMICLPNCPQALYAFYGVSRCGAIATMIHPLSVKNEIHFYLKNSKSKIVITMDIFCNNFIEAKEGTGLEKIVVTSLKDELNLLKGLIYSFTSGRKIPSMKECDCLLMWKDFMALSNEGVMPDIKVKGKDSAAILYSGGTTGKTKGILLSNLNINATALQTLTASQCFHYENRTILSVMPMFHGFGLCIGLHTFLMFGGKCILVPKFTPESYAKLIVKKRPNFIAGVPTLFEHIIRADILEDADLSCLKGVFVGGDTLTIELRTKMDSFLSKHGCKSMLREGYGLTECVTASCLTPKNEHRVGSIGIPFPDTLYKIVKIGTAEAVPYGQEGEICISGPSVMIGYVDEPEETADTLRKHADGRVWLHTGDLGVMDEEGFVYFKQRFKRMIISSGYNIYPSQIENILDMHPAVYSSCAIGISDDLRQQVVKAFVVLKKDIEKNDAVIKDIKNHCYENISRYAVPKEIEIIDEMPRTKVGKVAYTELEAYERSKNHIEGMTH